MNFRGLTCDWVGRIGHMEGLSSKAGKRKGKYQQARVLYKDIERELEMMLVNSIL